MVQVAAVRVEWAGEEGDPEERELDGRIELDAQVVAAQRGAGALDLGAKQPPHTARLCVTPRRVRLEDIERVSEPARAEREACGPERRLAHPRGGPATIEQGRRGGPLTRVDLFEQGELSQDAYGARDVVVVFRLVEQGEQAELEGGGLSESHAGVARAGRVGGGGEEERRRGEGEGEEGRPRHEERNGRFERLLCYLSYM